MAQDPSASTPSRADEHPVATTVRLLSETNDVIRARGAWAAKLADAAVSQAQRTHGLALRVACDHGRTPEDVAQLRVNNGLFEAALGLLRLGPKGMRALAARAEAHRKRVTAGVHHGVRPRVRGFRRTQHRQCPRRGADDPDPDADSDSDSDDSPRGGHHHGARRRARRR